MTKRRRLIYQINQARHALMKSTDAGNYEHLGISSAQLTALMLLKEHNGCLMKELAKVLMLDKSAVTGLAKRLEKQELIKRTTCELDSRASRLSLTDKGLEVCNKGILLLAKVSQAMEQDFTEQELDTVAKYLQHVTNTFTKRNKP